MTYTVTSFGKAFAHVRNCLLKKAHVINKNIDGFYVKTTQRKISTAISIKHRILATFNIKKNSILTACMPLTI
jgi:hypothetical protein